MRILCNAKDSHILSTKNNSVFAYVVGISLTSLGLNDDVKLTKFGTTGPRPFLNVDFMVLRDIVITHCSCFPVKPGFHRRFFFDEDYV